MIYEIAMAYNDEGKIYQAPFRAGPRRFSRRSWSPGSKGLTLLVPQLALLRGLLNFLPLRFLEM